MVGTKEYKILPIPKPRMTQRDKWKKRPCTARYRAYKDEIRLNKIKISDGGSHITFVLPMPKTWSKKKRIEMNGKPHQQTPDKDNLEKGLYDALFENDSHIWDSRVTKIWGVEGKIIIETAK